MHMLYLARGPPQSSRRLTLSASSEFLTACMRHILKKGVLAEDEVRVFSSPDSHREAATPITRSADMSMPYS